MYLLKMMAIVFISLSFTTHGYSQEYTEPVDNHDNWEYGYAMHEVDFLDTHFQLGTWNDVYYEYMLIEGDYDYVYKGSTVHQELTISDVPMGQPLKINKLVGNNMNNYGIWVDFNQDGDFADEGEFVKQHAGYWNSVEDSTFLIPNDAKAGLTRMRIRDAVKYDDFVAGDHTQDLGVFSQSLDIMINLTVSQAADNPIPANNSYAVATDAEIQWTKSPSVTNIDLYFSSNLSDVENKVEAAKVLTQSTATSYSPENMQEVTAYYWRVCAQSGGEELNSLIWKFTTVDPSAPAAATSPVPANEAVDIEVATALSWTNSAATKKIDLYISEDKTAVESLNESCRVAHDLNISSYELEKPLNGNSKYYWCVIAKGDEASQLTIGNVWEFTTEEWYCIPADHITSNEVGITSVKIQEINSGDVLLTKTSTCGESTYSDFTATSADLIGGTEYKITITGGAGSNMDPTGVWIDFNDDMVFDEEEMVFGRYVGSSPKSGEFLVPANSKPNVRMRVVAIDYTLSPCVEALNHEGETEDYTLNVTVLDADAGIAEIILPSILEPQNVTPQAKVYNFGAETATFNVTATNGDGYTSVKEVTALPSADTVLVSFDDWNIALGAYNIKVYTQQAGDLQHLNDTLKMDVFACEQERQNVLVEILTGTWCNYCPGAAMGADELVSNGKKVSVIEYHSGDSYTNPEGKVHINNFNAGGLPSAYFDGTTHKGGGSHTQSMYSAYLPIYEAAIALPTAYTLDYSIEEVNASKYNVSFSVKDLYDYKLDGLKLYVALIESEIEEEWQGQTKLDFVERKMYPNGNGFALDFSSNSTVENSMTVEIPAEYVKENCRLVAFVQNPETFVTWETINVPIEATQPSATFSMIHDGATIDNGSVIEISGFTSDDEIVAHMSLKNTADVSKDVMVKKEVIESASGHTNTFCWGDCFPPNVNQSTSALTIEAGATNSDDFSGHVMPNDVMGVTKIKYTFFEKDNEANAVYFTVDFHADIDFINELSAAVKVYPNPAHSLLNLSGVENVASVTVMNTVGQVIYSMKAKGEAIIQLNVADYPQGLYMVKLKAKDGQTAVKRVVITK